MVSEVLSSELGLTPRSSFFLRWNSSMPRVAVRSLKTETHRLPAWQQRNAVGTGWRCLETRFSKSITEGGSPRGNSADDLRKALGINRLLANMQIPRIEMVWLTATECWRSKKESWRRPGWRRRQEPCWLRVADFLSRSANDPCLPQFRRRCGDVKPDTAQTVCENRSGELSGPPLKRGGPPPALLAYWKRSPDKEPS